VSGGSTVGVPATGRGVTVDYRMGTESRDVVAESGALVVGPERSSGTVAATSASAASAHPNLPVM
jgi:hypothetical protein